jgi:hypothetical protein
MSPFPSDWLGYWRGLPNRQVVRDGFKGWVTARSIWQAQDAPACFPQRRIFAHCGQVDLTVQTINLTF